MANPTAGRGGHAGERARGYEASSPLRYLCLCAADTACARATLNAPLAAQLRGTDLAEDWAMSAFKLDLKTIRERAREKMADGPVTSSYSADRAAVIAVLNEVLATEIVCVMRYKSHHYQAKGVHAGPIAREFLEHAAEEQVHADLVARRIAALGGIPNFDPNGLHTRSHSEFRECGTLEEMIRENLLAERVAISTYTEFVHWLGNDDPTTRRMMEGLLADEEEHADDLATILARMGSSAAAAAPNPEPHVESHRTR
jgi:bacterioferritin